MEHQKSIFSSMEKSSRSNANRELSTASACELAGGDRIRYMDRVEAWGTDTPPEKEPRRIFSRKSYAPDDDYKHSFDNIMNKFVKTDDSVKPSERGQAGSSNVSVESYKLNTMDGLYGQRKRYQDTILNTSFNKNSLIDSEFSLQLEADGIEPETPGLRPFIPRLKRVQDDCSSLQNGTNYCFKGPTKRVKLLEDSEPGTKIEKENCSVSGKFEWLHPSKIRDSNGRRPTHILYDKTSLYIPSDDLKKMSASQKQYWDVKCHYMDVVLFFKVGKFYELYELDAEIGHKELDWKMTVSGVGKCRQVGISEAGIDEAVQKLVARGYKVGRMEQLETSAEAKARGANSVVQRKLISVVTPSTTDYNLGPDALHLLAIKEGKSGLETHSTVFGFAFVDCAALKFWIGSIEDDSSCAALGALLMQVSPKEVIHENGGLSKETQKVVEKFSFAGSTALQLTSVPEHIGFLDASEVKNLIESKHYFQGSSRSWNLSLDNVVHTDLALSALSGLVTQLARMMLDDVLRNGDLLPYQVYRGCLKMDGQTLHNLEIFRNNDDGTSSGTLFKYLDSCVTASGKRLLRDWICHPLKEVDAINNRLNVVEFLMNHSEIIALVAQHLRKLPDLERLLARVKSSKQSSVSTLLPFLGSKILKQQVKMFGLLIKGLRVGVDLMLTLVSKDRFISLFSKVSSLPALRGANSLDRFLTQFEAAIDSDFPNYQDHGIVESDAETLSLLIELFVERATAWGEIIHSISCIDVLRSFSITAGFTLSRPLILSQSESCRNGPTLKIKGLWHPYALRECKGVPVPNDLNLGEEEDSCNPCALLLTGPNMGGKSTILRATCLAIVLAQLGCYVPCEDCVISVVDTIFTRLGASDRIMTGESTFFIECSETASVLRNATQDSLVILDELGRGTSTFDGYAIAYAVFRHLIERVNCRLLFATHYHPLTKEFASHPRVSLQYMSCTFDSNTGELVFLYRLAPGACPESYGLRVALTAGIPRLVVEAATRAGRAMEEMIRESFRSSEQRAEFSTLHEQWLKGMLNVCSARDVDEEDVLDTLFCLWHELRGSYNNHHILEARKRSIGE